MKTFFSKKNIKLRTFFEGALVILASVSTFGMVVQNNKRMYSTVPVVKKDSAASVKAFGDVYKVLMSPRCLNCHPAGDIPLQGEDSHVHQMFPRRGPDGKGLYAMKCANCHQDENTPGLHMPPGNPKWHLPPADMKMVFEGKSPYQLAKQLMNKKENGNKSMEDLIKHADDELVLAGFNPADGLKKPPLTHKEFKKAWITWLTTGAYAPAK
ncbi:hypothetical protein SD427_12385 [Chryseobacterium sp. JJR-5R]|uniref:hypothetical protein n=1 Tax=Chryseobacterium sp. JJR-5R TaxID=3093923 RepID=UPI002A753C1F|nr:hypothetical protein [Chryseobacterium sp. JJR-5R]WPO81560.1 hypothetical protein SD427_12385 [Chryseobacterium sp. JJR-5R]